MTQFDDIIITPVYGPLTTNNYPRITGCRNMGMLIGRHPNPPQFYPSNGSSEFSNARHEYMRTASHYNNPLGLIPKETGSCGGYHTTHTQTMNGALTGKYIAPQCSSMFTSFKKRNAVGKSSLKQGLPYSDPLSYKCYFPTDVRNALRVTRANGCTAPAKKGSIYNTSLRTSCGWGSAVRSTY